MGVDVRIEDYSYEHAEMFNLIRENIAKLKRWGLGEFLPKKICLSDWRDIEKIMGWCEFACVFYNSLFSNRYLHASQ